MYFFQIVGYCLGYFPLAVTKYLDKNILKMKESIWTSSVQPTCFIQSVVTAQSGREGAMAGAEAAGRTGLREGKER